MFFRYVDGQPCSLKITKAGVCPMSTSPRPSTQELLSIQPVAPKDISAETPGRKSHTILMNFLEGPRSVSLDELRENDITRYQVTKFYQQQIKSSGYYEQLKYIVEPSTQEFESPGSLDTSGEHSNTVVPGLQHKYAQTGL